MWLLEEKDHNHSQQGDPGQLSQERTLLRLDGQYGNGVVLSDVAGFSFVTRGKDYHLLDHPLIQARLHLPPDQFQQRPESQMERSLYDCPQIPVGSEGIPCRVIVATHPAGKKKSPMGVTRAESSTNSSSRISHSTRSRLLTLLSCICIVGLSSPYSQTKIESKTPDRWCSHSAWGQEAWQTVAQWVWNLRLELGHQVEPTPLRITEFTPALPEQNAQAATRPTSSAPTSGYSSPTTATSFKTGRFTGADFPLQLDGTLRCPAGQSLVAHEQRREADGSLRVVYGASIGSCRPCPLREQCQWNGSATAKPRQVSILLHPLVVGSAPLLWKDWSRRVHRRACIQLLRQQHIQVELEPPARVHLTVPSAPLSRAERAHARLSWVQRLACNGRPSTACTITLRLFGVPTAFAASLGLESHIGA
ncbi:hypothetical protein [Ktedonobacter racemifer]|uniref:Uncharacterized protein n=1 Tax=Ktedonobacter racemifer DSM 44963 TaxID=485913 RepID=D6U6B1_KTERA|nr:hypothetical protein [Ktedonobacter racemifer]EFH80522.1 hypothetical protein Krac_1132 [Ktedonobacter racemifer DSM 44963]